MQYYDFTIVISSDAGGSYTVQAKSENYGVSDPVSFAIPSQAEIAELTRRLEDRETDREYLQSLGRDLFKRLVCGDTKESFLLSLGEVGRNPDLGLRFRLRINDARCAALPWEFIYFDRDQAFVGTRTKTPLVRYLDMPMPRSELAVPYPLRILVLVPRGNTEATRLDAASERLIIGQATAQLGKKVEVVYLHDLFDDHKVTWQRIADCLADSDFHCVHFVGHGTFRDNNGYLVLDGEDDSDELVEDDTFAELFVNSPTIKLVVLNACKGAALSSSQPLTGSAARLVRRGVPAVVAMQFSIYDKAAVAFAQSFYRSLFTSKDRGRVDVAVSRGRHVLGARFRDQRELAAPVLFMHAKSSVLLVPEEEGILANLPKSTAQLDTLEEAQEITSSDQEAAKFGRRMKTARQTLQTGLALGALLFLMSTIRVLDVFTIDTQVEFGVMALGNRVATHEISNDLRILTIDGEKLSRSELRQQVADTVRQLSSLGARTVALDVYYPSEEGTFKSDPASGQLVVDAIRDSRTPVVIGAAKTADIQLDAPDSLRRVASAVGFLCYEKKLGLTRSLPISALISNTPHSSFALEAVAAFKGARVIPGFYDGNEAPALELTGQDAIHFEISEINRADRKLATCDAVGDGDLVAHRFIRRTPDEMLASITLTAKGLEQYVASEQFEALADLRGKLVLVGVLGRGDIVHDLAGDRDGVFWQADALNNLLLDEVIKPVGDGVQLVLMLILAVSILALCLRLSGRPATRVAVMIMASAAIVLFAVYLYGRHDVLLNPVYFLIAIWLAWLLAARFGKKWLKI